MSTRMPIVYAVTDNCEFEVIFKGEHHSCCRVVAVRSPNCPDGYSEFNPALLDDESPIIVGRNLRVGVFKKVQISYQEAFQLVNEWIAESLIFKL